MRSSSVLISGSALVCLTGLLSCAKTLGPVVIDGIATPRATNEYVGQPYSIRHYDAYPKSVDPSGGLNAPGGTIAAAFQFLKSAVTGSRPSPGTGGRAQLA